MNTFSNIPAERPKLHQWIDSLPPRQFDLVYLLVEELIGDEHDETAHLLGSQKMRERLQAARESKEGVPIKIVREKLGV